MAINLPSGFNILNIDPVDSRFVVQNQSELLGFSAANVYEGLLVYQTDNNTLFVLTDIANYNSIIGWEVVGGLTISGSTPSGEQINKVFSNLQFDSSTGLNVTESISGTAFVSIGSHFRDIIVSGSATLVATGSDSLEIIAGDGIQIFTSLSDTNGDGISKELEFRLDTSSQHFTNAVTNIAIVSGIFTLTGSFYSTTNNIQITGSLSVGSGSFKSFEVNSDGFVVLGDMNKDLNNAPIGTIAYSASSFYLIS
jgi:hypothetical protein